MKKEVTIKEFKEWLRGFPEETIVTVAIQERPSRGSYESYGAVRFGSPVLDITSNEDDSGWSFTDFRANPYVKEGEPHFGKCILELGEGQ